MYLYIYTQGTNSTLTACASAEGQNKGVTQHWQDTPAQNVPEGQGRHEAEVGEVTLPMEPGEQKQEV
jgi:hypothetical protein